MSQPAPPSPAGQRPADRSPWRAARRVLGAARYRLGQGLGLPEVSSRRLQRFVAQREPALDALRPPADRAVKTLAVVMPVYAHARYLPFTLRSLAAQTRLPDQFIAVDDASPDDSQRILEATCAAWPPAWQARLRVLRHPANEGQSTALNHGIAIATTDLIMILNDDDALIPDAIEVALELYARHPDLAMVGATCIPFADEADLGRGPARILAGRTLAEIPVTVTTPAMARQFRRANDLNMTHTGCTFRRLAWQAVGGYCRRRSERVVRAADRDFQIKVNALFPVGVRATSLCFWRSDSSVDAERLS